MEKKNAGGGNGTDRSIKKTLKNSLLGPAGLAVVMIIYVVIRLAMTGTAAVETEPAAQVTLDDAITVENGCFIRSEQIIDVKNVRTAEYRFSDGDKVGVGETLVTLYQDDKALEASQELEEVQSTISQLETLQSNSYVTNTSQIDQKITTELNSIAGIVDSASFSQLSDSLETLRADSLKSGTMDGEIKNIDSRLKKLKKKEKKLKKALKGKTDSIKSESSGYFCQTIDGYEEIMTVESLDSLSPSSFEKLMKKNPKNVSADSCKIVDEYIWYYAALMSVDEADRLEEGQEVTLRFSQPSDNVKADVYAIRTEDDSDNALVIIESDDMNDELVSMRKEVGDIVIDTYKGLRVPKDAIHMQDDQMGVYIMKDKVASFKAVTPIYEGSDFYIVEQNVIGDDSLVANDKVIVHAKDVDDKKVVK